MGHDILVINIAAKESAKSILKAELAKRGISYQRLAELLNEQGWSLNKAAIDNRMSRGAFSADFFLDALRVIGSSSIGLVEVSRTSE